MPVGLGIRDVDDALAARLKRRAARHGRSAEAELRDILAQALENEAEAVFDSLAADLRRVTADPHQTPAELLQREGRVER